MPVALGPGAVSGLGRLSGGTFAMDYSYDEARAALDIHLTLAGRRGTVPTRTHYVD